MEPRGFLIIIGAAKSGTTTLAQLLGARSDMVLCRRKEPRFHTDFARVAWSGPGANRFTKNVVSEETEYLAAFESSKPARWNIDASTDYLWCPVSCDRIAAWAKRFEVKLIAILRDPVDRAFSEYQHTIRDHLEMGSLKASLNAEENRRRKSWLPIFYHIRRSHYAEDIARYAAMFGDQLMVMDYAELSVPEACLQRISAFLDVPFENTASRSRHNASYSYRSRWLARLIDRDVSRGTGSIDDRLAVRMKKVLPKEQRQRLKSVMLSLLRTEGRTRPSDTDLLISRLAPEYARCAANPLIRTERWVHTKAALAAQRRA